MKYLITLTMLCVVLQSRAQIREFYLESTALKPQKNTPSISGDRIEFTGVSISPVKTHLKSFLQNTLHYERNGYDLTKLDDSTFIYKERYITSANSEINPENNFLDVEYKLHTALYDSIIENITFKGNERMIGDVYKKYWNAEINLLHNADKRIVASTAFKNDSIKLIQTIVSSKQQTVLRHYSISVQDKKNNMDTVLQATKKRIASAYAEKSALNQKRKQTVYHFQESDSVKYLAYKSTIENALTRVLHGETNRTGNVTTIVKADTLGRTWIEILGKNASVNTSLRDELRTLQYENITYQGFAMTTVDTFKYEYSCIHEEVHLRKNTIGVRLHSSNYPQISDIAKAEAMRTSVKKADMKYDISHVVVNGRVDNTARNTSTITKATGGQIVGGVFLTILSLCIAVISEGEE